MASATAICLPIPLRPWDVGVSELERALAWQRRAEVIGLTNTWSAGQGRCGMVRVGCFDDADHCGEAGDGYPKLRAADLVAVAVPSPASGASWLGERCMFLLDSLQPWWCGWAFHRLRFAAPPMAWRAVTR